MKIAVIGAGIVGVTTAFELGLDGHEVCVFEKNATIAEEASFATGCNMWPSLSHNLAYPVRSRGALSRLFKTFSTFSLKRGITRHDLQWMLKWSQSGKKPQFVENFHALHQLMTVSLERLAALQQDYAIAFEQGSGQMLLFSSEKEANAAQQHLAMVKELGIPLQQLSLDEARKMEPGLATMVKLHSAVLLPQDALGNCRQFAQMVREKALGLGVTFRFGCHTTGLELGGKMGIQIANQSPATGFDRVVICSGTSAPSLLATHLPTKLPCASVQGYSLSVPIREALNAPRNAITLSNQGITFARIGSRIRVCGGADLGNAHTQAGKRDFIPLYRALQHYFPGGAHMGQGTQTWKGSYLTSSDGLPLIGASKLPGVYFNLAHGINGWGMACGAAQLLRSLMQPNSTPPTPYAQAFSPARLGL